MYILQTFLGLYVVLFLVGGLYHHHRVEADSHHAAAEGAVHGDLPRSC